MAYKLKIEKVIDSRFLEKGPSAYSKYCVENVKSLFNYPGKSSLAQLHGIQKEHYDHDDSQVGFEID